MLWRIFGPDKYYSRGLAGLLCDGFRVSYRATLKVMKFDFSGTFLFLFDAGRCLQDRAMVSFLSPFRLNLIVSAK